MILDEILAQTRRAVAAARGKLPLAKLEETKINSQASDEKKKKFKVRFDEAY